MSMSRMVSIFIAPVALCTPLAVALLMNEDPQVRIAPTDESPSQVERLIDTHDCWTGAAPDDMSGQIPGHVLVTTGDGRTVRSARLVGPALDQLFGEVDHDLAVHAFCR